MQNLNLNPGSLIKLEECHQDLQLLIKTVAKTEKLLVVWGYRGQADQNKALAEGKSKKKWPDSRHNSYPSLAVDIAPIPLDWGDEAAFYKLGGIIVKTAAELGIHIKWGASWGDLDHFELVPIAEADKADKLEIVT